MTNNDILHFVAPNGKLIPQRCTKSIMEKNGYWDYLINLYSDLSCTDKNNPNYLKEILYRLIRGINNRPVCKQCGTPLFFKHNRYSDFCSTACSNKNKEVLLKNKTNVSLSLKNAYKERGNDIKEKRRCTLHNKYKDIDVISSSPFGYESVKKLVKDVIINKYGVDNIFKLDWVRSKSKIKQQNKSVSLQNTRGLEIEYLENGNILLKNACDIHGNVEINKSLFNNRVKPERIKFYPVCPICNPPENKVSYIETFICDLLKDSNIDYISHDRNILNGKEIDILIPSKNLAIECNGLYWHSELFKDKYYHQEKTKQLSDKNIQLIHLWEDDFKYRKDIVVSLLKSKLGLIDNKIYARKCNIKNVSPKDAKLFLTDNHIQGYVNSSIRYGLYYNEELVAVMTFGKLRKCLGQTSQSGVYEMYRYATLKNTNIVGGASKLLNYFHLNNPEINKLISYAKLDYSNGNLYDKLGFNVDKMTPPNYYWVINSKRENRFKYRKSILSNDFNSHLSETDIMHNYGAYRVFDSGNLKFVKYY